MSESNPTPEIKIATQEANGTITTPSKVEMKEFSSEDLALISRRLNVLRDNSASTLAQKENSLIAKKEKLEKMIADLKAEKADAEPGKDAKLTQDEVDHAITEDDFEKKAPPAEDKTQPKTIAEVQKILPENSPISQDVAKILDKNGIMPDGFLKKIFEFLHKHLGGSEISFDQSGMYNTVVGPYLKEKGFKVATEVKGQDGNMMPVFDKNTGARVMKKLASLGVPLAESGKFLGYIMGDIPEEAIDIQMRPLFHAGKDHYENTPGAEKDINIALNFVPPQLEQPKVDTRVDPNAPKDNEILLAGEKLSGSPEDIKAYTSLSDTARKILGKSFDEKSILSKVKDIKPEDKITGAGKEAFIQIVDALKAAYGNDFASKLDGTKVNNATRDLLSNPGKITGKELATLDAAITGSLEFIFANGVNTLETQITDWDGKNLDEEGDNTWWNDEVAEKLLASVKGRNEKETKSAVNEIGFAGLIAQNIAQIKHFNDLKSTLINPTAITAFNAGKPELKTEIA